MTGNLLQDFSSGNTASTNILELMAGTPTMTGGSPQTPYNISPGDLGGDQSAIPGFGMVPASNSGAGAIGSGNSLQGGAARSSATVTTGQVKLNGPTFNFAPPPPNPTTSTASFSVSNKQLAIGGIILAFLALIWAIVTGRKD